MRKLSDWSASGSHYNGWIDTEGDWCFKKITWAGCPIHLASFLFLPTCKWLWETENEFFNIRLLLCTPWGFFFWKTFIEHNIDSVCNILKKWTGLFLIVFFIHFILCSIATQWWSNASMDCYLSLYRYFHEVCIVCVSVLVQITVQHRNSKCARGPPRA